MSSKNLILKLPRAFEILENRHLLAGDFQTGDANQDYYFDEADLLQVMKIDKFETGEEATWTDGDWNGDMRFTRQDIIAAFQSGLYRRGPYDAEAGEPVNQLMPLSDGEDADVTLFYFPANGDVVVVAPNGTSSLQMVSRSGSLNGSRTEGLFDFADADNQFRMSIAGETFIQHDGLLPSGWSQQQVMDDLLIDGSTFGGGDLGVVRLGDLNDFPVVVPELPPDPKVRVDSPDPDPIVTIFNESDTFVERDQANAVLTYDPTTGDIRIDALDKPIVFIQLISPQGYFEGTTTGDFVVGDLDSATPRKFIRINPSGMETIDLPGIARVGLSQAEFVAGVRFEGGFANGEFHMALVVETRVEENAECQHLIADGSIPGDANLDGRFDSRDLVTVFQAGEYEDDTAHNSTWQDGDWTCDSEFDSRDLVAAFQGGNYESPAAAVGLRRLGDPEFARSSSQSHDTDRITKGLEYQFGVERRIEITGSATSANFRSRRLNSQVAHNLTTDEVMTHIDSFLPVEFRVDQSVASFLGHLGHNQGTDDTRE